MSRLTGQGIVHEKTGTLASGASASGSRIVMRIEDAVQALDAARIAGDSPEQAVAAVERVAPELAPFVRRALASQELTNVLALLTFLLTLAMGMQQRCEPALSEEQMARIFTEAMAQAVERLPGNQATAPEGVVWPEPGARDAPDDR